MPIVVHTDVPSEPFPGGATYQHVVGDPQGSTSFRIGIQTSPPGYRTPLHSHPYTEALTIVEGEGEAWMEGRDVFPVRPGMTLVFPPRTKHWFRALGTKPLITWGLHASPHRIVDVHPE
jgi:quercetin dioxygenase-like cupin family protein